MRITIQSQESKSRKALILAWGSLYYYLLFTYEVSACVLTRFLKHFGPVWRYREYISGVLLALVILYTVALVLTGLGNFVLWLCG